LFLNEDDELGRLACFALIRKGNCPFNAVDASI
jgi:hypothetical protein